MWSTKDSEKCYHLDQWGQDLFSINPEGHLSVHLQSGKRNVVIDLMDIIEEAKDLRLAFPLVIRFHDILRRQVINLNKTFHSVIEEAEYKGRYYGVFPIKVNQMKEVVEEIIDAGTPYQYGIEVGSRPELIAGLAMNHNRDSLTIVNGYKDEDIFKLSLTGRKLGKNVLVVIEKYSELPEYIKYAKEMDVPPMIGIRAKLSTKGAGKWSCSSGEQSKFGLSVPEILNAINYLKSVGHLDALKLFHFHIGSQVTDIRAFKEAISEGARIFAKMKKLGVPLEFFDVGGGIGVDYMGSKTTTFNSSMNYNLKEYVEDVVYGLKQICDLEDVDHPHIVTETGRAVAAPHSCVVTNIFGMVSPATHYDISLNKVVGEHVLVSNMREVFDELNEKNIQLSYNYAGQNKEEMIHAFKLGVLSLEERAKIEAFYWKILLRIKELTPENAFDTDDYIAIEKELAGQYLCNFSIFQSALDTWAIKQVLPVCPIQNLNEKPTVSATLADITCDSDGKIDHFIDDNDLSEVIPLHELTPEKSPYYIGIFMTGAYQDIMGDHHNLFGRLHEAHVYLDEEEPKGFYIEETIKGQSCEKVLSIMQYSPDALMTTMKKTVDKQVSRKKIRPKEGVQIMDFYENCLREYTYLKN